MGTMIAVIMVSILLIAIGMFLYVMAHGGAKIDKHGLHYDEDLAEKNLEELGQGLQKGADKMTDKARDIAIDLLKK